MSTSRRFKVLAQDPVIKGYKAILPLTPGAGFVGAEPAMAAIGTPGDDGYNCKAIARWDVVPWQVATDGFNVGVVAYHREGIEKVSFSLNDGPWVDVFEMSTNPTTDELEYCVSLSLSTIPDAAIEVRARVIPNVGEPRILAGAITGNGKDETSSIFSGEHSMFLAKVNTPRPEFFVSPTGDDANDGSRASPFATIPQACWRFTGETGIAGGGSPSGDISGGIITMLPGDHYYDLPKGFTTLLTQATAWITVRADVPGTARFTSSTNNSRTPLIHIQGMQFVMHDTQNTPFGGSGLNALWLDNCDLQGGFRYEDMLQGYENKWATDCNATDVADKLFGTVLTRNCHFDGLLSDSFGLEFILLSSSTSRVSRNQNPTAASAHPDVWSKATPTGSLTIENVIVRDLTAKDRVQSQGLYMIATLDNAFEATAAYKDFAFININIDNSSSFDYDEQTWTHGTNGQQCFPMYSNMHHFLMYNGSSWAAQLGAEFGGTDGVLLTDTVFKNNIGLDPVNFSHGTTLLLPSPDGKVQSGTPGEWSGTWEGPSTQPLPWLSPTTNIYYTN